ncbi:hypothetical protein [Sphingomonas sp. RIT328]|uniref:hypothetical protein n=1 Tax=Sphingomonas sp. RIT328 TaxID=1470591 RepID=UPI000445150F|nr:hypothetical protein [Sphingomonas sp. RIT328]EZP49956.1 hypothetical protein BW41_03281 [Sphingomonas sp. RIT328]
MKIGVSGHQEREGADWRWTADAIKSLLGEVPDRVEGWSSLAVGADQIFAEKVLEAGGTIVTVVPGEWYEQCYEGDEALETYRRLLGRGRTIPLNGAEGEEAFLQAGLRIAQEVDLLFAVWDGKPARGRGGTGDIVEHARLLGKPIRQIDPVRRELRELSPD